MLQKFAELASIYDHILPHWRWKEIWTSLIGVGSLAHPFQMSKKQELKMKGKAQKPDSFLVVRFGSAFNVSKKSSKPNRSLGTFLCNIWDQNHSEEWQPCLDPKISTPTRHCKNSSFEGCVPVFLERGGWVHWVPLRPSRLTAVPAH